MVPAHSGWRFKYLTNPERGSRSHETNRIGETVKEIDGRIKANSQGAKQATQETAVAG